MGFVKISPALGNAKKNINEISLEIRVSRERRKL